MHFKQNLYNFKTRLLDLLCDSSAGARRFVPEENILIFSFPRSGSTWVMELIGRLSRTAMLWEPLHLGNFSEFKKLGFGWRQHIPEQAEWEEARETFERLFKGEFLNFWLSSRDFPLKFCVANRMIIKFVRANGMLPWLTKNFNFQSLPIYLLRHPFAVVASQMKEGSWDDDFNGYRIPDMPFNYIYANHESFLSSLETKQEAMVANWCINNKVVLENSRNDIDWITLHYESLLLHPEENLQQVFSRWDLAMPKGILDRVRRASSTTEEATFKSSVQAQLTKWKSFFDPVDISQMQRVLEYFEIDVYSKEVLPEKMGNRSK